MADETSNMLDAIFDTGRPVFHPGQLMSPLDLEKRMMVVMFQGKSPPTWVAIVTESYPEAGINYFLVVYPRLLGFQKYRTADYNLEPDTDGTWHPSNYLVRSDLSLNEGQMEYLLKGETIVWPLMKMDFALQQILKARSN
jgi:hypothetical protein